MDNVKEIIKDDVKGKFIMSYEIDLMFKVAELYYIDEFKQEKIARRLNISKYKVSRVLKKAKEEGVVKMQVIKPVYSSKN